MARWADLHDQSCMHVMAGYGTEQHGGLKDRESWHMSRVEGACDSVSHHMRGDAGAMPTLGQHLEQYGHAFTPPRADDDSHAPGQAHSVWTNCHCDWNTRSLGDRTVSRKGAHGEAHDERNTSHAMNDTSVNRSHRRLQHSTAPIKRPAG